MKELAYVNGVYGPIEDAKVSIEDRGFQFGDGVYEVVAAYRGEPFLLDRHMARLRKSAEAIRLRHDFGQVPLEPIIHEGLRRCERADLMVYVQITRGAAPRSHLFPANATPTVVMTIRPLPRVADEVRRRGARLLTVPECRWAQCFIKAITLLPNVLARNEAGRQGFDDALFVSSANEVLECTSSNVFLVQGRTLRLPARTESILHGVTQAFLMECAREAGLKVEESRCDLEMLRGADEVFISSTTVEVLWVSAVDGRTVGQGAIGPATQQLHEIYQSRIRSFGGDGGVQ
jgi:D-alanine transaminase